MMPPPSPSLSSRIGRRFRFWRTARGKITVLGTALFVGLIVSAAGWFVVEGGTVDGLFADTKRQQSVFFDQLVSLYNERFETMVFEYTYWDELCDFIKNQDQKWGDETIAEVLPTYRLDAAWAFNTAGHLVYSAQVDPTDDTKASDPFPVSDAATQAVTAALGTESRAAESRAAAESQPESRAESQPEAESPQRLHPEFPFQLSQLLPELAETHFCHCYRWIGNELIEIRGGEVHASTDTPRTGTVFGYFFAARYWNRRHLGRLEQLTFTKLSVHPIEDWSARHPIDDPDAATMRFTRPMNGFDRKAVASLLAEHVHEPIAALRHATTQSTLFFVVSAGLVLSAILFAMRRWITKPLAKVSHALAVESATAARDLASSPEEFQEMARLVTQATLRRRQLKAEIECRNVIAKELSRARDQAMASTKAKSQFLANMSHEIRTPMNGVIGMLQVLGDTPLDANQRDCVATIERSATALLAIINDILDFSKIEAGKMTVEMTEFDLRTVIEDVVELLAPKATEKSVELACDIAPSLPSRVVGDVVRMRQIMTNLIGNAIKFTEVGGVYLTVGAEPGDGANSNVTIIVEDTGIGIPKDRQQRIFEGFTQADGSMTRRFGGTGLGLAISHQLVGLMNGTMTVDSDAGMGSKFTIKIPMRAPLEATVTPIVGRTLVMAPTIRARRSLRHQLEMLGGVVTDTADAAEFGALLRAASNGGKPWDLVAADVRMFVGAQPLGGDAADTLRRAGTTVVAIGARHEPTPELPRGVCVLLTPFRLGALRAALRRSNEVTAPVAPIDSAEALDGLRVLLAEDNVVNQKVAAKLLSKWGCAVDIARNGREAVEALSRGSYDLILMDCQMPEMDGYEATRTIRARQAGTDVHIPIIAMTAHAMEGDRDKCLSAGMDDYITKPVIGPDLRALIVKWTHHAPTTKH